jgi:hypothetical protein
VTGRDNYSRALANLVQGYALHDAWQASTRCSAYTHYTGHGASRLDRFYLTAGLMEKKRNIETLPAAFTDHFAVVIRISVGEGIVRWKLNCNLLTYKCIQEQWEKWKQQKWTFPTKTMWWVRYCKKRSDNYSGIRKSAEGENWEQWKTILQMHL